MEEKRVVPLLLGFDGGHVGSDALAPSHISVATVRCTYLFVQFGGPRLPHQRLFIVVI